MKKPNSGRAQLLQELELYHIPTSDVEAVDLYSRVDYDETPPSSDIGLFGIGEALEILERYWVEKDSFGGREEGEPLTLGIRMWTNERVFFTHDYDGQISVRSIPRNPTVE